MRKLKGPMIRKLRDSAGISRAKLSEWSGIHPVHLARMETGEVQESSAEKVSAIAALLKVDSDVIAEPEPIADVARWAKAHGYTLIYAQQLAREGRIEGATKDESGQWRMEPTARKLPPTDKSRAKERERYRSYRAAYQRRRRADLRDAD